MFRIFKVLKEISLYREYLKVIKKESLDSPEWSKLRLRKDWFGRIYTVFNLPPEVTKSPDFPKYARPAFVFDQIKPIKESFLVVYSFVFRQISILWMARLAVEITLIAWTVNHWDWILSFLPFIGK